MLNDLPISKLQYCPMLPFCTYPNWLEIFDPIRSHCHGLCGVGHVLPQPLRPQCKRWKQPLSSIIGKLRQDQEYNYLQKNFGHRITNNKTIIISNHYYILLRKIISFKDLHTSKIFLRYIIKKYIGNCFDCWIETDFLSH